MAKGSTTQRLLFSELSKKKVVVEFDQLNVSSDGGAILLKAADDRLGLTKAMSSCVSDGRVQSRIEHEVHELFAQRVYAIACGYPDGNDAARLSKDPVHRMAVGRDPVEDPPLASQPTISRFENSIDRKESYRLGKALAESVIERHRRRLHGRARKITIDLDPTNVDTYGEQQLALFNGHYESRCYLPMLGFISFDKEKEQYLCAAILRSGTSVAKVGTIGLLRRLLALLRKAFPKARFIVRLDSGFNGPEIFDYLESEPRVKYVVGMAKNPVLKRRASLLMRIARIFSNLTGQTAHRYGETSYKTGSWDTERRIIIKAEVVQLEGHEPKDNPRFLVTNMKQTPRFIYEKVYCMRGDVENRIKELKDALLIDRTSCSRFWANQLRVLLTAAAYVLMQELRLRAAGTSLARAQVTRLRDCLLKIGARVCVTARRIVLHVPMFLPYSRAWHRVARSLGASAG